jgi:hypothetical protein
MKISRLKQKESRGLSRHLVRGDPRSLRPPLPSAASLPPRPSLVPWLLPGARRSLSQLQCFPAVSSVLARSDSRRFLHGSTDHHGWADTGPNPHKILRRVVSSLSAHCFFLKKVYLSSPTLTQVRFFFLNFKTGQIISLNFFKPCILPPSNGFEDGFATVTGGMLQQPVVCYSVRVFVFSFFIYFGWIFEKS